ncbi:MAG: polymer-forming cytoskeletal protein [Merismopedia sp. SIO2A8]|nr:polymer-forming cytoskeletal protein [Merismopedia sp. SIO2A8]
MFWQRQASSITYLGEKSEFQGDLHVEGDLQVDGIVHGNVEVLGNMEISQGGLVEGAELKANNLVVHGVVKARLYVQGQLTITSTARLEGDVTAHSLDIEAGAFYIGHIATQDSKASAAPPLPVTDPYPELMGTQDGKY